MMVATDPSTAVRPEQAERGHRRKALAGAVIQLFLPAAVLLLMAYFAVQSPVFLTYENLMAIATQNAATFIVSAALGAMLIAGYVDLSVGSMLAVAAVAAGVGWTNWGTAAGLGLGLLVGLVTGVVNGALIAYLNWSPIVVGLGLLAFGRGLALFLAPDSLFGFPAAIAELGSGEWLGVSYLVWIAVVVCVSLVVVMERLPLGRHITAIGVNKRAAFLAGVNVRPIVFGLYVTVGVAVALAGVLFAARLDSAPAGTLGVGFELTVLTAVLLGGIPFDGGRGSLWRVLVGVWLLGVLQNGITLMNIGPEVASMLTGGVLVLAAGLEAARRYLRN